MDGSWKLGLSMSTADKIVWKMEDVTSLRFLSPENYEEWINYAKFATISDMLRMSALAG
jgi:hypothetical protein